MRMQISFWLFREFWQVPQGVGLGCATLLGGGSGEWVEGEWGCWRFVCCYTKLHTHSMRCIAWHLLLMKSIAVIYHSAGGTVLGFELWRWLLLHSLHDTRTGLDMKMLKISSDWQMLSKYVRFLAVNYNIREIIIFVISSLSTCLLIWFITLNK